MFFFFVATLALGKPDYVSVSSPVAPGKHPGRFRESLLGSPRLPSGGIGFIRVAIAPLEGWRAAAAALHSPSQPGRVTFDRHGSFLPHDIPTLPSD